MRGNPMWDVADHRFLIEVVVGIVKTAFVEPQRFICCHDAGVAREVLVFQTQHAGVRRNVAQPFNSG